MLLLLTTSFTKNNNKCDQINTSISITRDGDDDAGNKVGTIRSDCCVRIPSLVIDFHQYVIMYCIVYDIPA